MVSAERMMLPLPFVPTKGSTKNSSQGSNFGFKRYFCLKDRCAHLKQSNGHLFLTAKILLKLFPKFAQCELSGARQLCSPRREFIFLQNNN